MSFDKAFEHTVGLEGGYSNVSGDNGGETCFGVTIKVARSYGYGGPMKEMPLETAKLIYKALYWDKLKLDTIDKWDAPTALELFDTGVNCGTGIAATFLQIALNVLNRNQSLYQDTTVDGSIGQKTIDAVLQLTTKDDKDALLKLLNSQQGQHYINICLRNPTQEKFIRGWINKRV